VATAGSIHLSPAAFGHGTEVRVTLEYDPPGGKLGAWLAWLFVEEPGRQIEEELQRFKSAGSKHTVPSLPDSLRKQRARPIRLSNCPAACGLAGHLR
jgi:uncharacterized membrane protein